MPRGIPRAKNTPTTAADPEASAPEPDMSQQAPEDSSPEPEAAPRVQQRAIVRFDQPQQDEPLPLSAAPAKRKGNNGLPAGATLPVVASEIFAIVTTGYKGQIDIVPLHEVPLLRRKRQLQQPGGEVAKVLAEYPEHLDRVRKLTAPQLRDTYARLKERYEFDKPGGKEGETVDLVAQFYGIGLRNLQSTMRRLEAGYRQIMDSLAADEVMSDEQLEELVRFADPDFDIEGGTGELAYEPFEPAGAGNVVTSDGRVSTVGA